MNRVIVITGPTATGKTSLGVSFAERFNGEVVSADSMQIYKHMDIGTAKPTTDEMCGIPHHMIDCVSPFEDYSAARYVEEASACCDDILARGKIPIIVGGTGLYIDSLLSGRDFAEKGDTALRDSLNEEYDTLGGKVLLARLSEYDPESADRLHVNDKKRIVRALEVFMSTGITITEHDRISKTLPAQYDAVKLALTFTDRDVLYERINQRVDKMMSLGLENEVRTLLDMGIDKNSTAMQAIGYKELVAAIEGNCSIPEAVETIKQESRRYAKRQLSWLRRDSNIHWIFWNTSPNLEDAMKQSAEFLQ